MKLAHIKKEFGFDSNIKLIYNGFTAISQQIYPYIYSGKINILFAGRFVPQKGIPVLINIIKRVDEKVFYFHIAGKGTSRGNHITGVGK